MMEDRKTTGHANELEAPVDEAHDRKIDSAPVLGELAITADQAGPDSGEQRPVPDERIEKLARAAAQGAATEPEAEIRYEYRKRALLREKARLERDRRLVVARKRASQVRPA